MTRWLFRPNGKFSAAAWVALATIVAVGFAAGFAGRPVSEDGAPAAAAVAPGKIEADLPATGTERGPTLTSAAALPSLGSPARRVRVVTTPEPTLTPEPTATATPIETATTEPAPAATVVAPVPTAAPPQSTPAGTTFDSSG